MILGRSFGEIGINCVSPIHIINPYDGKPYTVPCGKCAPCLNVKRSRLISQIETLRHNSAVTYFVHLTYDSFHLPVCCFGDGLSCVTSWNCLHRAFQDQEISTPYFKDLNALDFTLLKRGSVDTKCQRLGSFRYGVLVKKDLQLFFKRLRRYFNVTLSRNIKFKYFAIGEYGCEAFRPHYHAIISLPEKLDYATMYRGICYAWKFGRVRLQVVRSSAASYCASYINSFGKLPHFLSDVRQFAPFKVRSCNGFYEMWDDQIEKFVKDQLYLLQCFQVKYTKSGYVDAPLSRSSRLFFYPVIPGFHSLDFVSLRKRYLTFYDASREQKTLDPLFSVTLTNGFDKVVKSIHYSELYHYRKSVSDWYIDNYTFQIIYISHKVFSFVSRFNLNFSDYVNSIIYFYKGRPFSENQLVANFNSPLYDPDHKLPSSSFALSLLRYQYSVQEYNIASDSDVRLYLEFNYNYAYPLNSYANLHSSQFDHFVDDLCDMFLDGYLAFDDAFDVISKLSSYDISDDLSLLHSLSVAQSDLVIKHKDRNTYHLLEYQFNNKQNFHDFISSKNSQK